MQKKGFFTKLKMWFWTKKKTMDYLDKINKMMATQMFRWVHQIEELDQNKIYVLQAVDATAEQVQHLHDTLKEIKSLMRWTPPNIIIVNQKIEELDTKQLKKLINKKKQRSVKKQ